MKPRLVALQRQAHTDGRVDSIVKKSDDLKLHALYLVRYCK